MISTLRKLSRIGVTDGMSERELKGIVSLNMLIITQTRVGVRWRCVRRSTNC